MKWYSCKRISMTLSTLGCNRTHIIQQVNFATHVCGIRVDLLTDEEESDGLEFAGSSVAYWVLVLV
jgi:hypothetical protein